MAGLTIQYLGKTSYLELTHDKTYQVISIEHGWYRIIDDSGEDYLYPPDEFKIVNNGMFSDKPDIG